MNDSPPQRQAPGDASGLCSGCAHAQVVTSARGSIFYLCRLSFTDGRFPRYPPIPVLICSGFQPRDGTG